MNVYRCPKNPIITPEDVKPTRGDFEVIGTFNAGVTRFNDQVLLLLRVAERPINTHPELQKTVIYNTETADIEIISLDRNDSNIDFSDPRMTITPSAKYLTSLSHFRIATSDDGTNFNINEAPALFAQTEYETFGLEDPRITQISDTYHIDYVAVSPLGVTTALASTKDFVNFERKGVIFCPDNKDVVLFPEKINGSYYALHRPVTPLFEKYEMWIAQSPDILCWGNHRFLMTGQAGLWDENRIGASAVPFKIDSGWLEVYHGVDNNNRYCLGAVLLDEQEPWKVLGRTKEPILAPETDYEIEGFFGNVVFNCGLLCENEILRIYYGVADTSIAYAELSLADVLNALEN
jgi:predicted GH43/DUF377 family glycosyl hydrolase